jgi:hypothetical protein
MPDSIRRVAEEAKLCFLIVDKEDVKRRIAHNDAGQFEQRSARSQPGDPEEIIAV